MRRSILVAALVGVVVVGVLVARRATRDDGTPVSFPSASATSRTLDLGTFGCDAEIEGLDVHETTDEVHVRLDLRQHSGAADDCGQDITVELDQPFGDRRLIDDTTGDEVVVGGIRRPVPIDEAIVNGDDRRILLVTPRCGQAFRVDVDATADVVTVGASMDGPNDDGCPHHRWQADLGEPLGDRTLVDELTGEEIPLVD